MRTTETFKLSQQTWRTKKCRSCGWTFTSVETLNDENTIPNSIRNVKHKRAPREDAGGSSAVDEVHRPSGEAEGAGEENANKEGSA